MMAFVITLGLVAVVLFYLFLSALGDISELRGDNAELEEKIRNFPKPPEPKPISAPISPDWLSSDILSLRKFLNDESGRKLIQRGRAISFANAIAGSNDQFHTVHSAGRTAGFSEALNWIESCASDEMLSRVTGAQATKQNTSDSEQDDAALLERFSP